MANTTLTNPSSLSGPPADGSLNSWLLWAALMLLGLLGFVGSSWYEKKQDASVVNTQLVATQFQSSVNSWVSDSLLAARGDLSTLEGVTAARNQVRTNLSLLQQGGYAPSSSTPVLSLNAIRGVPVDAVFTQVDTFDRSTQAISGASDALRASAQAEQDFRASHQDIVTISSEMGQSTSLSGGAWGNALTPLRQEFSRRDVSATVSALASTSSTSAQWVQLFKQRATDSKTLADLASRDQNLSSADRQLISRWNAAAQKLAIAAERLNQGAEQREMVMRSLDQIQTNGANLKASTASMLAAVQKLAVVEAWVRYIPWLCLALTVVGILGALRSLWSANYGYWNARQDGMRGVNITASVERLTKDLRRILSLETNTDRLNENPDSPVFVLTSLINKALGQRSAIATLLEEQGDRLRTVIGEMDVSAQKTIHKQSEQKEGVGSIQFNMLHAQTKWDEIREDVFRMKNDTQDTLESSHRGEGITQENLWQMESLRENTQSTAKRIKRLGENAQNIGASADVIKDVSRKIKVVALNVAVEAASRGEHGRGFDGYARELERLAQSVDQTVKDIDLQIDTIQNDSKETVSSMENGTSEVVKCARLTVESGTVYKELAKSLEKILVQVEEVFGKTDDAIVSLNKEIVHVASINQSVSEQEEAIRYWRQQHEPLKNAISSLRGWLNTIGRDI